MSLLFCQEVIYSENVSLKKIPPGSVLADLGDDINAVSLTTIILDGLTIPTSKWISYLRMVISSQHDCEK